MTCPNCSNDKFSPIERALVQTYKGQRLLVKSPMMLCSLCSWAEVGIGQMQELQRRTDAEYQKHVKTHHKKHKLYS